MKVLVLGDGLLGSEIVKQTGWDYYSRKKDGFEVGDNESFNKFSRFIFDMDTPFYEREEYDTVINCIGYTNTYSDEQEKHKLINYKFPVGLSNYLGAHEKKLIHISTDYVYAGSDHFANSKTTMPIPLRNNWYSYYKLLADEYIQFGSKDLVIRCGFKPRPYPYDKASSGIWG